MSIRNMMIGGAGASPPGAPTSVSAGSATATTMSVSFSAPANNGGSAITGFTVTSSPAGGTATGASSPLTVTGLTASTSYTFTVTATNAIGTGPASDPSSAVSTTAAELYAFSSVTFNGNASGSNGPSLSTIKSNLSGPSASGSWKDNTAYLTSNSGRALWTVPSTGTYTFSLGGARGGTNFSGLQPGGYGAIGIISNVSLTLGDQLEIVAGNGGQGTNNTMSFGSEAAGGGGGASYVAFPGGGSPIAVAACGGGGSQNQTGISFTSWVAGTPSTAAPHFNTSLQSGGTGSHNQDVNGTHEGGGGGGWAQQGIRAPAGTLQPDRRHGRAIGSAYGSGVGGASGADNGTGGEGGFPGGGGGGIGNGAGGGGGGMRGGWGGVYADPGIGNGSTRTGSQSGSGGDSYNLSFTGWNGGAGFVAITKN